MDTVVLIEKLFCAEVWANVEPADRRLSPANRLTN